MKRIVILLIAIVLIGAIQAQTNDTIRGIHSRFPGYYYARWYDTCGGFFDTAVFYPDGGDGAFSLSADRIEEMPGSANDPLVQIYQANECLVKEPTAFTGIAVMTICLYIEDSAHLLSNTLIPDSAFLMVPDDSPEGLRIIAKTRWDTISPKYAKLPRMVDTVNYGVWDVKIYETRFEHPIVIDSVCYLSGLLENTRSNHIDYFFHRPECYFWVWAGRAVNGIHYNCDPAFPEHANYWYRYNQNNGKIEWSARTNIQGWCSLLPMVDSATIVVESDNLAMGAAGPTRSRSKWVTQTITATPEYGYRFAHWNDGNTDNPRDVYLTQDTHFTAYFEPNTLHTVQTRAVPVGMGIVTGEGQYWRGDTATLTAVATALYTFYRWSDGHGENPRRIAVSKDTLLTAYFWRVGDTTAINPVEDALPGLFTLTPNPTTGSVTLQVNSEKLKDKSCSITVLDAAGHEVLRTTLNSQLSTLNLQSLPAGTYFVTLSDGANTATQKLILK